MMITNASGGGGTPWHGGSKVVALVFNLDNHSDPPVSISISASLVPAASVFEISLLPAMCGAALSLLSEWG